MTFPLPRPSCRKILGAWLLSIPAILAPLAAAAQDLHSEAAVKAALVYNFAKFVDWPLRAFNDAHAPLTLCIYREGNSDMRQSLAAFAGKTAQGREIAVRGGVSLRDLGGCQVLYIPGNTERWLPELLRAAHAQHILTVSDMDDFVDNGGAIELLVVDNQRHFAINLDAVHQAGLKMSSQLLKLARIVKGQTGRN